MNYNILSYAIYLPIIALIMIKVGWMFYIHGELYLTHVFNNNSIVKSINSILLAGYYLLNLGYAIFTMAYWNHINSMEQLFNALSSRLGLMIMGLAILHYNNVFCINYFLKTKNSKF